MFTTAEKQRPCWPQYANTNHAEERVLTKETRRRGLVLGGIRLVFERFTLAECISASSPVKACYLAGIGKAARVIESRRPKSGIQTLSCVRRSSRMRIIARRRAEQWQLRFIRFALGCAKQCGGPAQPSSLNARHEQLVLIAR